MKKISILIPAHNEENYIGKCLDSLVQIQDENMEIIVCDNNSTDHTCAIVEKYSTVTLVHETKKGPNAARQKAFSVSTGTIIATLDADCVVPHNWISSAIRNFDAPAVVGVSGVFRFQGSPALKVSLAFATDYLMRFFHWLLHRVLHTGAIMPGGNAWFTRSALTAIGGFNTDISFHGDDTYTATQLGKQGLIIYDPHVVVDTSARRFEQGGFLTTAYRYILNFITTWIIKKQATSEEKTNHYR